MTGQILCSFWLPWLFLAEPKSDTSGDFYNAGDCPPRNWLSVHIKVNNNKNTNSSCGNNGGATCSKYSLLWRSIPSAKRKSGNFDYFNWNLKLGTDEELIPLQLLGTFGGTFQVLGSTLCTIVRSTTILEEFCTCMGKKIKTIVVYIWPLAWFKGVFWNALPEQQC